jgi:formiminotetrahydrofolate cyclodeaminase
MALFSNIEDYLDGLASDHPTPGGGSASAFAGALAASLVSMTAGLSVRRGRLEKKELTEIRRKASSIRKKLFLAIHEDARIYEGVLKAFQLPKETEKERFHRSRVLQKAYEKATTTPHRVCEGCLPLLEFSRVLISKGNPNACSDAGVAALLASAAIEGGLMNIRINQGFIRNRTVVSRMEEFMKQTARRKRVLMRPILRRLEETC